MGKRPLTRVQEVRELRGLSKSELADLAGMPRTTLSRIEKGPANGGTKSLSPSAAKLLAKPLRVREDQLQLPVGFPLDPEPGEAAPIVDLIYATVAEILAVLRDISARLPARPLGAVEED